MLLFRIGSSSTSTTSSPLMLLVRERLWRNSDHLESFCQLNILFTGKWVLTSLIFLVIGGPQLVKYIDKVQKIQNCNLARSEFSQWEVLEMMTLFIF